MSAKLRRSSFAGAAAFAVGVPLGAGVLWAVLQGPWHDSEWKRYVEHPVEMTEVLLFCSAVTALAGKLLAGLRERRAVRFEPLPRWDGKAAPATEAKTLLQKLAQQPGGIQRSWLGRRIANILEFVQSRGDANELDDQLRTFADNDAIAQEASFSLLRLIIWAVPILGFLGTVVGITGAIAGVTPETLEQSLSGVTKGLSTAFDATALALFLTMILMVLSNFVERIEQNVLQQVDAYVDAELAHRFERTGPETSPMVQALRQGSESVVRIAAELVEKQATLWSQSLERMERRWNEAAPQQFEQIQRAIAQAVETTLTRHGQHLRQTEDAFLKRSQTLLDGLTAVAEKVRQQTTALAQMHDSEAQLLRLQESLNNNLAAVANTGAFDQAVQSLTAAIHLLTARVGPVSPSRLGSKPAA